MYIHGKAISYVIVDECLHEVGSVEEALKVLAEKVEQRRKYSVEQIQKLPKFAVEVNKRPPEPNDWRRKGRRGFNGYNRFI